MNIRLLKLFIQLFLLTILLYFVGKAIIKQISNIHWETLQLNYVFLLLTLISDIITRVFGGILYSSLLMRMNSYLPYRIVMSISWLSLLGKYIPGKIAILGSSIYLLSRFKVRPEIAAIVPVLANVMVIIACLFLSIPLLFSQQVIGIIPFSNSWLILVIFIVIFTILFKNFLRLMNWLLNLLRRQSIQINLSFKQMVTPFVIVLAQCLFTGLTTWLMMRALTNVSVFEIPMVIFISVLAGTLGFLVFFSPAGLGVREGVYLLLLSPFIGSEMAVLTAVCLRLLQTLIDLVMGIAGWVLLRLFTQKEIKNVR